VKVLARKAHLAHPDLAGFPGNFGPLIDPLNSADSKDRVAWEIRTISAGTSGPGGARPLGGKLG